MKKIKMSDILLVGTILLIIVVAFVASKETFAQEELEYPLVLTGEVGLNQITYDDYATMVENEDTFIVIIERAGCGYCQQYMPIAAEVANELKVALTYIDTDTLSEEEFNLLSSTNNYLKRNNWGTPTTLFMKGSRVIDVITGYVEKDTLVNFLNDRVVFGE